jgi:hypothetical protein
MMMMMNDDDSGDETFSGIKICKIIYNGGVEKRQYSDTSANE